MRKIAVYVSFMNDRYRAQLRTAASEQGFDLDFYDCSRDSAALLDRIGDYEIIYGHPDPAWLKRADRLRWLCSDFAGVEKYLDEAIWPSQGCLLSNSSGAYGPAVAEHIVMVLLMLLRRIPEYEAVVRDRGWSNQLPIRSIRDNAFTLLGTGNIGVNVAQRLRGMGAAKITGLSRSGQAVPGFDEVYPISRLEEILPSVKVLVMSLPGTPETIHILNRDRIALLPPDINEGEGGFSVSGKNIRYGMSAIKSVGHPVIEALIEERKKNGPFKNLEDFITRLSDREMNKRAVENLIKAGAMDTLAGNRRQKMMVYQQIMESISHEKKTSMSGQISLFDLVPEEDKKDYEIRMPDAAEFDKETLLAFEKEVLGVYISGHPLEEYEDKWKKNITAKTTDFLLDDETGTAKVQDSQKVTVGGMLVHRTIKYTKNNKTMAFLTLEDLVGTLEIIVFPRDYEKYRSYFEDEARIFAEGRVTIEEEKNGKLILERVYSFDETPKELWLQFPDMASYQSQEPRVLEELRAFDGQDDVVVYIADRRVMKRLGPQWRVAAAGPLVQSLRDVFGQNNVKVVEKKVANSSKRY